MNRVFSIRRIHNIPKKGREALKDIKTWQNCCARVWDKGSRFAVMSNDEYCKNVNTQIYSSFSQFPHDITKSFEKKISDLLRTGNTLEFSIKNGLAISNLTIVNLEQCIG